MTLRISARSLAVVRSCGSYISSLVCLPESSKRPHSYEALNQKGVMQFSTNGPSPFAALQP